MFAVTVIPQVSCTQSSWAPTPFPHREEVPQSVETDPGFLTSTHQTKGLPLGSCFDHTTQVLQRNPFPFYVQTATNEAYKKRLVSKGLGPCHHTHLSCSTMKPLPLLCPQAKDLTKRGWCLSLSLRVLYLSCPIDSDNIQKRRSNRFVCLEEPYSTLALLRILHKGMDMLSPVSHDLTFVYAFSGTITLVLHFMQV